MKLLIAGAGGHGRVVADAALASGKFSQIAFLDDGFPSLVIREKWPVVGRLDSLPTFFGEYTMLFSAFGVAAFRLKVVMRASEVGFKCPTIVHPASTVSRYASIGNGSIVCAGGIVNIGVELGHACIVNTGATVDHDCRIDEGVHICPGGHLAGNVEIGSRTWFGVGAVAKQGVKIGADVTIGAGAVVISDVPAGKTFVGIPAREMIR